jgi:hypothetical protein
LNFIQRDSGAEYDSPVTKDIGITGLLETLRHGKFCSPVSRAEFAPKLITYPQVIWCCSSHTRATSLPNNTVITDSFLWAEIYQNLDPPFPVAEDCSHSNHRFSRPTLLLGNTIWKLNSFTTIALVTLQCGQVAHQPGLFRLVYPKSYRHCSHYVTSRRLPLFQLRISNYFSKHPAAAEYVSLLTCTLRGFPVVAIS